MVEPDRHVIWASGAPEEEARGLPRLVAHAKVTWLLSPLQARHAFYVPCAAHALLPGGVLYLQGGVLGLRGEGLRRCRRVAGDEELDGLRRDATLPPCGGAVGRRGPCFVPGLSESVEPRESSHEVWGVEPSEARALRGAVGLVPWLGPSVMPGPPDGVEPRGLSERRGS